MIAPNNVRNKENDSILELAQLFSAEMGKKIHECWRKLRGMNFPEQIKAKSDDFEDSWNEIWKSGKKILVLPQKIYAKRQDMF